MVTSLTNSRGGSVLSSFQYSYFLDGNIYRIVEPNRTTVYTYDMARRLVREESQMQIVTHLPAGYAPPIPLTIPYPSSTISLTREYFFDNRNNRTRMTTRGSHSNYDVVYSFDLNNRLLTSTTTYTGVNPRTITSTFTYDRNGNQLTSGTTGQPIETRRYNAFNQLIEVTRPRGFPSPPAITASYTYRGDGLRHSKTVNGATITHVWDRGNIVLERNQAGNVVNRYDRTSRGQLIHSHVHGFYHFNARGDVVQRTDAAGHVVMTYQYDAFGNELNPSLANNNPFRFAGEYWDFETGTYYLRARSFNPRTGRFTQPDAFWGIHNMQGSTAAILQSGNLYVYTINNPIMWSDPSGEFIVSVVIGGAMAAANAAANIVANTIFNSNSNSSDSSSSGSSGSSFNSGGSSTVTQTVNQVTDSIVRSVSVLVRHAIPIAAEHHAIRSGVDMFHGQPHEFRSKRNAILAWSLRYHPLSGPDDRFTQGREFGAWLFRNSNNRYHFDVTIRGADRSVGIPAPRFKRDSEAIAWIHTHPNATNRQLRAAGEFFSGGDGNVSARFGFPGFVVTPSGVVRRIDPHFQYGSHGAFGRIEHYYMQNGVQIDSVFIRNIFGGMRF